MKFVGREKELAILRKALERDDQYNILVFGRRRIGKSQLIKESLTTVKSRSLYFECKETTERNNVDSLTELICEAFGTPPLFFGSIEEVFEFLFKESSDQGMVLVLDEYPFLRSAVKGLDSIVQSLIDKYRESSQLKLVLCGSYIEIMRSLLEEGNPLYGRIDRSINLGQMDYYDAARFYPSFSDEDKVRLYSVFGGVPYYNRLIDQDLSVKENIIELVTSPDARLQTEVTMYLRSEMSKVANANEVFEALARGYVKFADILSQSHVSSSPALADVLKKLMGMELVEKVSPINEPNNARRASYRIYDPLSHFYYRFVFPKLSQIAVMEPDAFFRRFVEEPFSSLYVPEAFERMCKQYLIRKNRAGGMDPPFELIGKYYYDDPVNRKNGEFNVVTFDERGYAFYEAKFKSAPVSQGVIDEEIRQVEATGLQCYKFGFFSRSGFSVAPQEGIDLIDLAELYQ